ncbi:MAG: hypothetical protein V1806_02090 [Pseudomonadota bacterium]
MDEKEVMIQLLMKEYELLTQEIKERVGRSDKIMGFGITIIGAGISYGINEELNEILILMPLAFMGIILYAIYNTTIVMALGGCKQLIAERVNDNFPQNILIWESISRRLVHHSIAIKCLDILYAIFLGGAIIVGLKAGADSADFGH